MGRESFNRRFEKNLSELGASFCRESENAVFRDFIECPDDPGYIAFQPVVHRSIHMNRIRMQMEHQARFGFASVPNSLHRTHHLAIQVLIDE